MKLVNACALAKKNPKFEAPDKAMVNIAGVGDFVKICDMSERFWVRLTKKVGTKLTGTIANKLISGQSYNLGTVVKFSTCNVYDVQYSKRTQSFIKKYYAYTVKNKWNRATSMKNMPAAHKYYTAHGSFAKFKM